MSNIMSKSVLGEMYHREKEPFKRQFHRYTY
jgi:hypothetical protein